MADEQLDFYERMVPLDRFVDVVDPARYVQAPRSWVVVVTDVVGSTQAIAEGRYREVNLVGAATIACAVNAYPGPRPPYVFGGDGATILVPRGRLPRVGPALNRLAWMARHELGLELRAGAVPVGELLDEGRDVRVAKYAVADDLHLATFLGDGLDAAVARIKDPTTAGRYSLVTAERPALGKLLVRGLNCRWEPVRSRHGEILAMIVKARDPDPARSADVYRATLAFLDRLTGGDDHPVTRERMQLARRPSQLAAEATLKTGRRAGLANRVRRLVLWLVNRVGAVLMRTGWRYPASLIAHTDVRRFDGALRMVLDVKPAQRAALEAYLDERHRGGELVHGIASSREALMTCLVYDREHDHVHFVDGAEGGFTVAARQLDRRLRSAS